MLAHRGADESYKSIDYYKANLESDASRVNNLFKNAESRGLGVEMKSLPIDDVILNLEPEVLFLLDCAFFRFSCHDLLPPHPAPPLFSLVVIAQGYF